MLKCGFYPEGNRKPPQTTEFTRGRALKNKQKNPMRIGKLLKINLSTKDTRVTYFKIRDNPTMSRNGQNN